MCAFCCGRQRNVSIVNRDLTTSMEFPEPEQSPDSRNETDTAEDEGPVRTLFVSGLPLDIKEVAMWGVATCLPKKSVINVPCL